MIRDKNSRISDEAELEEIFRNNEAETNLWMVWVAMAMVAVLIVYSLGLFLQESMTELLIGLMFYLPPASALGIIAFQVRRTQGRWRYSRTMLFVAMLIACSAFSIYGVYGFLPVFTVPILVSSRYYESKFAGKVVAAAYIAALISMLISIPLAYGANYYDVNMLNEMGLTRAYRLSHLNRDSLPMDEVTVSMVALIQAYYLIRAYGILLVPSLFAIRSAGKGRELIITAHEVSIQKYQMEITRQQMEEVQYKMILSQIQPHFVSNTMAAIMAIDGNPEETVDALDDFCRYLRENMNTLSIDGTIPVAREMEHVRRYVHLQQLRYGDRLQVEYELKDLNFEIPPLTIQMLAENAICHGISKRLKGGKLQIITEDTGEMHQVRILDDGVGFDPRAEWDDSREHIGLNSVKSRIERWNRGTLEIHSTPGVGTTCVLLIPRTREEGDVRE